MSDMELNPALVGRLVGADLNRLPAVAADIAARLREAGFTQEPHLRQALAVAEEAGEFVGAVRRFHGLARRPGSFADVCAEAADVVITMFVTAHEMGIDLPAAIAAKVDHIYRRGWREPTDPAGATGAGVAG